MIWVVGLVSGAGLGAWLAETLPIPLLWRSGALIGIGLGVLLTVVFLRVLEHDPAVRRNRGRTG